LALTFLPLSILDIAKLIRNALKTGPHGGPEQTQINYYRRQARAQQNGSAQP
jgi:hypothetical protein